MRSRRAPRGSTVRRVLSVATRCCLARKRAACRAAVLQELRTENVLSIPMRPGNRSLNLANAVALVLYEAWRQQDFA